MTAALLQIAGVNAVASGAALTLVIPLALLVIALLIWLLAFRRQGDRKAPGS